MMQLPIPVHIGSMPLDYWDDIEVKQREHDQVAEWLQKQRRPAVASPDLDWDRLGFEPRCVGFDTADCAVVLQPNIVSGQGADEFNRFRQGAESRGETALVISPIGDLEDKHPRSVIFQHDDSVPIGLSHTSVISRPIGRGARVRAAGDLGNADGQLALRMLNCNPSPTWRSLSLSGAVLQSYNGRAQHPAEGTLVPILETELGEPVVAAWVSPDGVERRYVVPVETPWPLLLPWLLEQGLPEFVPGAMLRARRQLGTDQTLMTRRERDVRTAPSELEADYVARRSELESRLEEAQTTASTVRDYLLYGTGKQLEDAVRSVLEAADITIVDLDEKLGGTKNADLLCTFGVRSRLVEVKSASGNASERVYQDLVRHLREWPSLPGNVPVEGGALILNHEHRSVPGERSRHPYRRPEFLAAQTEPVITTLDLFDAWRQEDAEGVRRLLFGPILDQTAQPLSNNTPPILSARLESPKHGRRRWLRRV